MKVQKKIFTSREEIIEYLGVTKYTYKKFIRMGMPVLYLEGRCFAHLDNIEAFFRSITARSAKNSPEAEIDSVEGEHDLDNPNGGIKKDQKTPCGQKSCHK